MARTIEGNVRPFGTGTKPCSVLFEWPESLEEIEVLAERVDAEVATAILVLAAKKGMIYVQDYVRTHDVWEDREAPEEEDAEAWNAIQEEVTSLVQGAVIDPGTYPGQSRSKKKDRLQEARSDAESAQALIDELRARHEDVD